MEPDLYLEDFLKKHLVNPNSNWILAISGGVDSSSLLHAFAMLAEQKSSSLARGYRLIVLSLNHGWREESTQEVDAVEQQVQLFINRGLPFIFHTASMEPERGLSEAAARLWRYRIFQQTAAAYHAPYIFLGHHRDDVRETVFKQVLEGKELSLLYGMREEVIWNELHLFRPWLKLEKQQLVEWAHARQWPYVVDPTNFSSQWMRGSMRSEIFPVLDRMWPKQWRKGLDQISDYSAELFDELKSDWDQAMPERSRGLGGWWWSLPSGVNPLSMRLFLRLASFALEPLGRAGTHRLMESPHKDRSFRTRSWLWKMVGGHLYALRPSLFTETLPNHPLEFKEGDSLRWGPWEVAMVPYTLGQLPHLPTPCQVAQGEFLTGLSKQWTHLGLLESGLRRRLMRHLQRGGWLAHTRRWLPLPSDGPLAILPPPIPPYCLRWTWKDDVHANG